MKKLLMAAALTMTYATWAPAELVANGNFSEGMSNWQLNYSAGLYGKPDPEFRIADSALTGSNLHGANPPYLVLSQAVNIQKGVRYKLSYEIKAEGEGTCVVSIKHVNKEQHFGKVSTPGPSWETVEAEFTGKYDTDISWFRKWRQATKKNKLQDGQTPNKRVHELHKTGHDDPPSHSILFFSLGGWDGSLALRNVSIVEVQE